MKIEKDNYKIEYIYYSNSLGDSVVRQGGFEPTVSYIKRYAHTPNILLSILIHIK
jgi:hypothetical protein